MLDQLENLFSITVGFLGFLVIIFMLFSFKSNVLVNSYLIIVFLLVSIRLVHKGVLGLDNFNHTDDSFGLLTPLFIIGVPSTYLYLKSLFKDATYFSSPSLIHFIFPALNLVFTILQDYFVVLQNKIFTIVQVVGILIYLVSYTVLMLIFVAKNLNKETTTEGPDLQHVRLIKKWTLFFGTVIFILSATLISSIINELLDPSNTRIIGYTYSSISSIIWLITFSIILINPEILHGYPNLKNRFVKPIPTVLPISKIWNEKEMSVARHNLQDSKLGKNITDKTITYLSEIENFVTANHPFRNSSYSIKDLAEDLKMPVSHLSYIFKYHCKMPFVEYKNYARILDAVHLIRADFLAPKTLEALSIKVGFTSYNPFYTSFKKHTGQAPKDFLLNKALKTIEKSV